MIDPREPLRLILIADSFQNLTIKSCLLLSVPSLSPSSQHAIALNSVAILIRVFLGVCKSELFQSRCIIMYSGQQTGRQTIINTLRDLPRCRRSFTLLRTLRMTTDGLSSPETNHSVVKVPIIPLGSPHALSTPFFPGWPPLGRRARHFHSSSRSALQHEVRSVSDTNSLQGNGRYIRYGSGTVETALFSANFD